MTQFKNRSTEPDSEQFILPSEALARPFAFTSGSSFDAAPDAGKNNSVDNSKLFNSFQVKNINLLFNVRISCQVCLASKIYPMPNSAYAMSGVCSYKGSIVPVFSIHRFIFDEPLSSSNQFYLLIFGGENSYIAVYSDSLPKKISFTESQIRANSIEVNNKLNSSIKNTYKDSNGGVWFELDAYNFFNKISNH